MTRNDPTRAPLTNWTAEEDHALRELAASGISAVKIAAVMGKSRNAIIGRARRAKISIGYERRPPLRKPITANTVSIANKPRPKQGGWAEQIHAGNIVGKRNSRKHDPLFKEKVANLPIVATVKLADLRESQCKFPIGDTRDDAFGFCGARRLDGYPYCSAHCRISFVNFQCARAA